MRLLTRRMWFKAALFCVFAVVLALAGSLIGQAISYEFATNVGAKSVDHILNVLASSMLAVTTFSLTARRRPKASFACSWWSLDEQVCGRPAGRQGIQFAVQP